MLTGLLQKGRCLEGSEKGGGCPWLLSESKYGFKILMMLFAEGTRFQVPE